MKFKLFRFISAAAIVGTIFLPAMLLAEPVPETIEDLDGSIPYRMITLKNGMKVITVEDHTVPKVAVQVWYHVGSKDEDPTKQGFAHMFEHMMFRGTLFTEANAPFDLTRSVGGDINAYTSFDQTVYVQTVPSNQLEMILWLESDRMAFLKINDENFQVERKVVEEERRMGAEKPYGTVFEKLFAEVFKEHPYRWTPIGNIPMLRAATSADLQNFWETYYVPNNATLVVVGAVNTAEVEAMAQRYFGWIPRAADPPRVAVREPALTGTRSITIKEPNGPTPIIGIGFFSPSAGHPDEPALEMMLDILGTGESSRLYRRLVDEEGIAVFAGAGAFGLEHHGIAGVGAVLPPFGAKKADASRILREEIEKIQRDGVTEEELLKARNNKLTDYITSLRTVESKAGIIGQAAVIEGDVRNVNREVDQIRSVTAEDIHRVANQYLDLDNRMDITIEPSVAGFLISSLLKPKLTEEEEAPVAQSPEGARFGDGKPGLVRPELYSPKPPVNPLITQANLPKPQEGKLKNGLKVVVIEDHEIPYVSYTLGLKMGAFADPQDRPGTASMAASMLTRGTENFTYNQLTDESSLYAISLGGGVDMDSGTVSAGALTEERDRAMRLLSEVVRRPTFPDKEFNTMLTQMRTGMTVSENDPSYLADRMFREALYGSHPYSRSAGGELEDLGNLTTAAARDWWFRNVRPDTSVLYIAGDIKQKEAMELAKTYFGDWRPEGKKPSSTVPKVPSTQKTQIVLVDKPATAQTQIRAGHVAFDRSSPDFIPTRLANQVFGSFTGRVNSVLRVEKGLTYGAGGGFRAQRFGGAFVVSTFSKTEGTPESVKTILEVVNNFVDNPPSKEELESARNYLVGGFISDRETPGELIADEWAIELNGLPKNYYQRYLRRLSETDEKSLAKVLRQNIRPEDMTVVVVGEAEQLREDLEKIAPVVVVPSSKTPKEETPDPQ